MKPMKPYMNPYVAGVGLGLVLLLSFFIVGRGLGASGALSSVLTSTVNTVAPSHVQSNAFYSEYYNNGNPLKDWLVFEMAGVLIGGLLSGWFSGRLKFKIEKSESVSTRTRFIFAFAGGILMGLGSKLARGCTSGQALTGGALMSVGSWIFIASVFITAYLVAKFFRRQWK